VRESLDGLAAYVVPGADAFSRWGEASQCSVSSTSWWTTIVGKVSSFVYTVHSRPMPEPDRRDRSHAIRTKNHPSVSKSRWSSACSVITERPCRPAHPDDQPAAVASATAVSRARALPETWRVHQSRALDRVDRALRKLPPGARIRIAREPESISQRALPRSPSIRARTERSSRPTQRPTRWSASTRPPDHNRSGGSPARSDRGDRSPPASPAGNPRNRRRPSPGRRDRRVLSRSAALDERPRDRQHPPGGDRYPPLPAPARGDRPVQKPSNSDRRLT
jgi:hypothetical protein